MTARRTPLRRTITPARELAAWRMVFLSSFDFFGDLADVGLDEKTITRREIEDAWRRLGRLFLEQWEPEPRAPMVPWALREFGEPPE